MKFLKKYDQPNFKEKFVDFIENHQNYEKGLAMTVYGCQMSQSFV